MRGKIYGIIQVGQPLGYMLGLVLATLLSGILGWRSVFYITGSLGLFLAVVIYFGIKEPARGQSEPELAKIENLKVYHFDKTTALGLIRKRSLIFLYLQGFVGVFPWNVITYWFFRYLETERDFSSDEVLMTMTPAILVLSFGYFLGGTLGDCAFKRTPRGRIIVSMVGVLTGAILLYMTLNVPVGNRLLFQVMLMLTALFIPFASPNVISTVYDITLPEVRSTALAVQYFIENIGAALAPLLTGLLTARIFDALEPSILLICITTWVMGAIFLAFTAYFAPKDINILRSQLGERAELERKIQANEIG